MDEIVTLDNLEELKDLSKKIDNRRKFMAVLDSDDKRLYKHTVERLRKDTNSELTETEYEVLATMMFFCDKFEKHFANQSAEEIDNDLFNTYRLTKTQIHNALKDYREKARLTPPSIEGLKSYLLEIETKDGKKIKQVIDIEDPIIIEEGDIIDLDD